MPLDAARAAEMPPPRQVRSRRAQTPSPEPRRGEEPNVKRTTIGDIAAALGLSASTVSKVLNGRGDAKIPEGTRERVRVAAAGMGYTPNLAARALVQGRTNAVAVWAETLADFHANIVNLLQDAMRPSGYEMLVSDVVKHPNWHAHLQRRPIWPVDGIIAVDTPRSVELLLSVASSSRPPVVSLGAYYSDLVDQVGIDLRAGVVEGVTHLVASGRRNVAYLVCNHGYRAGDARYDGYNAVMSEAGRTPQYIRGTASSRADGYTTMAAYLAAQPAPDALFCFNDEMALGAYRAIREAGLRVPGDIALMGCDGIHDLEYLECPMSTVAQPCAEGCEIAWAFLQRRIGEPDRPRQSIVLASRFVGRESTAAPTGRATSGSGIVP